MTKKSMNLTQRLTLNLSEKEVNQLEIVAEHCGLGMATTARFALLNFLRDYSFEHELNLEEVQ